MISPASQSPSLDAQGEVAYLPHNPHVRRPASIPRANGLHHPQYVPLHHPHKLDGPLFTRQIAQMLDEIHNIRPVVHGVALQLLEDARMEVLVHFAVLEGEDGGFLEGRMGGAEVREEGCEAHADFEGVGHFG